MFKGPEKNLGVDIQFKTNIAVSVKKEIKSW